MAGIISRGGGILRSRLHFAGQLSMRGAVQGGCSMLRWERRIYMMLPLVLYRTSALFFLSTWKGFSWLSSRGVWYR